MIVASERVVEYYYASGNESQQAIDQGSASRGRPCLSAGGASPIQNHSTSSSLIPNQETGSLQFESRQAHPGSVNGKSHPNGSQTVSSFQSSSYQSVDGFQNHVQIARNTGPTPSLVQTLQIQLDNLQLTTTDDDQIEQQIAEKAEDNGIQIPVDSHPEISPNDQTFNPDT